MGVFRDAINLRDDLDAKSKEKRDQRVAEAETDKFYAYRAASVDSAPPYYSKSQLDNWQAEGEKFVAKAEKKAKREIRNAEMIYDGEQVLNRVQTGVRFVSELGAKLSASIESVRGNSGPSSPSGGSSPFSKFKQNPPANNGQNPFVNSHGQNPFIKFSQDTKAHDGQNPGFADISSAFGSTGKKPSETTITDMQNTIRMQASDHTESIGKKLPLSTMSRSEVSAGADGVNVTSDKRDTVMYNGKLIGMDDEIIDLFDDEPSAN